MTEKKKIRVVVSGALGRMGSAAVKTFIENAESFELKAGVVRDLEHIDPKIKQELEGMNISLIDNLRDYFEQNRDEVDVLVELTTPDSVFENSKLALENNVRPVIGATGLSDEDIQELAKLSSMHGIGTIVAPNFALGAILMMKFARTASKYYKKAEIIEQHHDKKLDRPSGTAIKTAKLIELEQPKEIPISSVRLPGLVAKQQVIFGATGETLTVEHNTIDRSSFMPGILLSAEKVMELKDLVYGLDNVI